jgi:hypothetical protein
MVGLNGYLLEKLNIGFFLFWSRGELRKEFVPDGTVAQCQKIDIPHGQPLLSNDSPENTNDSNDRTNDKQALGCDPERKPPRRSLKRETQRPRTETQLNKRFVKLGLVFRSVIF